MDCHLTRVRPNYNKWIEQCYTTTFFVFNQIITRFGIPSEIVIDHGSHFRNEMIVELASKLGLYTVMHPLITPRKMGK
jgi:hypothetical protein